MKSFLWTNLRSIISNKKDKSSSSSKKNKLGITNDLSNKLNINEEYKQAFRTNSYIELTTTTNHNTLSSMSCLEQPHDQEFLKNMFQSSNNFAHVHNHYYLLLDYFEASFEALKTCHLLLQALDQTRINHAIINRVIKLITTRDLLMVDNNNNNGLVYKELLSSFSQLNNPFSILTHDHFLSLHDTHDELLRKLTRKRSEIRRYLRLKKLWKKAARGCFMISNVAVLVSLLILALHSLVGIVAAPGLIFCFIGSLKKKRRRYHKLASLDLVLQQMDTAARATYITMNDLDTLGRMVARLNGEIEHLRAVAEMWMKSSQRREILKEVEREFVAEDGAIVEQMKELQQHINLCFLTINRSRRLVMDEIVGVRNQNGS